MRKKREPAMVPIRIVKGLDVPIAGAPVQAISDGAEISNVALLGADHAGLRPQMLVEEGEQVELGQPLFANRKDQRILFTAPGSGRVDAINRGARRSLTSVVIKLEGDGETTFPCWPEAELAALRRDQVTEGLLLSGLWPAFRTRPYGRLADPDAPPPAIFVTAMDSNPLAASPLPIIEAHRAAFANGLTVVSRLTDGPVYVCQAPHAGLPTGQGQNVLAVEFAGPHPAGLVGTHIHFLDPVSAKKTVWHLNYQDVIAIGKLFTEGRLWVDRVVSIAGPPVTRPRLIRTRLGAGTDELVKGELQDGNCRIISGSILSGRRAAGAEAYLGRFHQQISVVAEEGGVARANDPAGEPCAFTTFNAFVTPRPSKLRLALTTAQSGGAAPMFPIGAYECVMPLDILPTPLVRALMVGDSDMAQALGCLELDEEDMALCSFVCPSKIDHGGLLRQMLDQVEKEW